MINFNIFHLYPIRIKDYRKKEKKKKQYNGKKNLKGIIVQYVSYVLITK